MRRVATGMLMAGAVALLAGCVGDTDPASDVRAHQAQLNAHGHTNNGPASWWWEYGISRKAVAGGQGTQVGKAGPASSPGDVGVSTVLTGLDSDQPYYFRACGQDQAAGSPATCGRVESFGTGSGDSPVSDVSYGVRFLGASEGKQSLTVQDGAGGADPASIYMFENLDPTTTPPTGSVLVASGKCQGVFHANVSFHDAADCRGTPHYLELNLTANTASNADDYVLVLGSAAVGATLGNGNDYFSGYSAEDDVTAGNGDDRVNGSGVADYIDAGQGNDHVVGGMGNDHITGGPGNDTLEGGGDDDSLYDSSGNDTFNCGPGNDTVYADTQAELDASVGCETKVLVATGSSAPATLGSARARMLARQRAGTTG